MTTALSDDCLSTPVQTLSQTFLYFSLISQLLLSFPLHPDTREILRKIFKIVVPKLQSADNQGVGFFFYSFLQLLAEKSTYRRQNDVECKGVGCRAGKGF